MASKSSRIARRGRGARTTAVLWLCCILATGCSPPPGEGEAPEVPAIADEDGLLSPGDAQETLEPYLEDTPAPRNYEALLSSLQALSGVPLYGESRAELLVDGPETYAAMLDAIDEAERYIHLETYIFEDGEVGQAFAEALKRKSRDGVAIRVIYDSFGSRKAKEGFFEAMQDAGIDLIEFNDGNPVSGGNPIGANTRDHRKLVLVDGRVAFTGGINFTDAYAKNSASAEPGRRMQEGWRDTHVAIYGPAVAGFDEVFEAQWRVLGGEIGDGTTVASRDAAGKELVAVLASKGESGGESPIYHAYLQALQVAEQRIWITQAYFAPDRQFMALLKEAVARGVDVRLIVPGFTDSALVLLASRSRYGELLNNGVRIFEMSDALLHGKTAVIDGIWSTVGSSNLDYRSVLHNDEVNAVVIGEEFGRQMEERFAKDLEMCREITLAAWARRPFLLRLKEEATWLIEYWL